MHQKIEQCRLCGGNHFHSILDVGLQSFTGIFPKTRTEIIPAGPLELVKCDTCDLVQLTHSFNLNQLYGHTYGYRSGLNASMVRHLQGKVQGILERYSPQPGDVILDIGSNDSTTLRAYPQDRFHLVGIDPVGKKFNSFYPKEIQLIPDFFSAYLVKKQLGGKSAKIVTSIAMFYDLEDPLGFAQEVADVLADDGIWMFEQSYLPAMLDQVAYDTICHEHLEYYSLKQIKWIADHADLKIIDVEFNAVNGGSFSVTVSRKASPYPECRDKIAKILLEEEQRGLSGLEPYLKFRDQVRRHREEFVSLVDRLKGEGKKILGYGASTKGNVLLQYCGFTPADIPYIAEINEDKFGSFTPGTRIPIISEKEALAMNPDCLLVLPWHFRSGIVAREQSFLASGGRLLFPLPSIEMVSSC